MFFFRELCLHQRFAYATKRFPQLTFSVINFDSNLFWGVGGVGGMSGVLCELLEILNAQC